MNKIAIIYTTFLRNDLAKKTLQSIIDNWNSNYILLIGDQNITPTLNINLNPSIYYFHLPYDCGLSYARNYLIQEANKLGIIYCLITADSIEFIPLYDFEPIISFMETDKSIVKIGFKLNNRISWEFNLDLKDSFILSPSNKWITYNQINYHKIDICRNFYLGKTEILIKIPYDNELKLLEHEDHCWRLKQAGYNSYFTNSISANYIDEKSPEYLQMRKRMYSIYKDKLLKKYNISKWISYNKNILSQIKKEKI